MIKTKAKNIQTERFLLEISANNWWANVVTNRLTHLILHLTHTHTDRHVHILKHIHYTWTLAISCLLQHLINIHPLLPSQIDAPPPSGLHIIIVAFTIPPAQLYIRIILIWAQLEKRHRGQTASEPPMSPRWASNTDALSLFFTGNDYVLITNLGGNRSGRCYKSTVLKQCQLFFKLFYCVFFLFSNPSWQEPGSTCVSAEKESFQA